MGHQHPWGICVTVETLPGSTLPDELRERGYDVREIGEGERILSAAITEWMVQNGDGSLGPLTAGSTLPVAMVVRRAGSGRCSAFASSHGARIQTSRSSSVVRITGMAFEWIGSTTAFGDVVRKP
jgi:hypothetical protein